MKTTTQLLKHGFIQGIGFCLALGIIIFSILLIINLTFDPMAVFVNKYCIIQNQKPLEQADLLLVQKLYSKNLILSAHDIFEDILSYYNTIITILVTVVGISSFVSYFYVKNISAEKAENMIRETVKKYFDTTHAQSQIRDGINKEVAEWMDNIPENLAGNLSEIETKIQDTIVRVNNIDEKVEALYMSTYEDDVLRVEEDNGCD